MMLSAHIVESLLYLATGTMIKVICMTRDKYLKRPTTGVTYKDFDTEDVKILKRLLTTQKLTEIQKHAILRAISMWHNLD